MIEEKKSTTSIKVSKGDKKEVWMFLHEDILDKEFN